MSIALIDETMRIDRRHTAVFTRPRRSNMAVSEVPGRRIHPDQDEARAPRLRARSGDPGRAGTYIS